MTSVFLLVWVFVFGTVIGSFLNVVIYRLPRELSLVRPGSKCPECGAGIRAHDNVPVLGWLWLGGKCRDCRAPIPFRYPFVEATTGLLFLLAFWLHGFTWQAGAWSFFFALSWVIFWIDLDHQLILDVTTLPGIAAGLLFQWANGGWAALETGLWCTAGAFAFFFVTDKLAYWIMKKPGMGGGDTMYAAVLGAWLGWPGVAVGLLLSFVVGSVVGGLLMLRRGESRYFPFGPAMVIGALLAHLWGDRLAAWYWGLMA